jgi:hypothetical protein
VYLYSNQNINANSSSRYRGFLSVQIAVSPTPNSQGQPTKMAQAVYESPTLASVAKQSLDGFTLKQGWNMSVAYMQ